VVFGPGVEAESVLARLDALTKRANRVAGKSDTPERRAFHEAIRARIGDPRAGGLAAAACPHLEPGDPLPVAGQVPHWLFAMKDTLAANCANALALIATHPRVQERARAEVDATDLDDPASVNRMAYLEGCLRDTMRLWPTTPVLLRRALKDDRVAGRPVPAGSQVIIHNGFNHRNPEGTSDPDGFHPDAWEQGVWDYRYNPMSNGPQGCAGRELVLFLGKAVLGHLLQDHRWRLDHPALDPGAPTPYAFDSQAVLLKGTTG
jgi:cytochrome P450